MSKKPLVILFDANPLVNSQKSGVGYYTYNLIQALADTYPDEIQLVGHYFNFLNRKKSLSLPTAPNISYRQSRFIPGKVISISRIFGFQPPLELFFKRSGDLGLFTNFVSLPSLTRIPKVIAVHDLCYIDTPEYVARRNREFLKRFVPGAIKRAALVITISEFTKAAITKHYGTPAEKVFITPIPPVQTHIKQQPNLKKLGITGKFILFVGTLEPRKNIISLVEAYEQLPEAIKKEYALVLAGGVGWYIEDTLAYIKRSQAKGNNIILPGYISDDEKIGLYKAAECFVTATHYEGFGMPVLEAMAYGLPVAASDIAVLHEVAGKAALYFDKDDTTSIKQTLERLLTDPALRAKLKQQGTQTASQYSWEKVVTSLYERLRQHVD